jgi:hypothetical protein
LEDAAESQGLEEAESLLPQLLTEMGRVEQSLAAFLAEPALLPAGAQR